MAAGHLEDEAKINEVLEASQTTITKANKQQSEMVPQLRGQVNLFLSLEVNRFSILFRNCKKN